MAREAIPGVGHMSPSMYGGGDANGIKSDPPPNSQIYEGDGNGNVPPPHTHTPINVMPLRLFQLQHFNIL